MIGGCSPCGLAIDAGEHPAQACAAWNRRQETVTAGSGSI
jgi:hypothetical protein